MSKGDDNCLQLGQGFLRLNLFLSSYPLLLPNSRCLVENYSDIENMRERDFIEIYSKMPQNKPIIEIFGSLKFIYIHIFLKIIN